MEINTSVITVTYNSESEIEGFMESCAKNMNIKEVIIIDNASRDKTVDKIKKNQAENVTLIESQKNVGLAQANNIGISAASGKYILIANPDIKFQPETVQNLVSHLEELGACAIGPVNVDENDLPHSSFHRNWSLAHVMIWRLFPAKFVRLLYGAVRRYRTQKVKFISGAFLLAKAEDLKTIKGYDPAFFLSVEDACDLCDRLRNETGKSVYLSDRAKVQHFVSRSAINEPLITQWMAAVGTMHYFRKKSSLQANVAWVILISSFFYRYIRSNNVSKQRQKKLLVDLLRSRTSTAEKMIGMALNENY